MFNINDLKFAGEATINNQKLVAYADGGFVHVYDAADPDLDLDYRDYNEFCRNNPAVDDVDVLGKFAAAVGLKGVSRPGCCSFIEADDEV